jgi:hypothetical protein
LKSNANLQRGTLKFFKIHLLDYRPSEVTKLANKLLATMQHCIEHKKKKKKKVLKSPSHRYHVPQNNIILCTKFYCHDNKSNEGVSNFDCHMVNDYIQPLMCYKSDNLYVAHLANPNFLGLAMPIPPIYAVGDGSTYDNC